MKNILNFFFSAPPQITYLDAQVEDYIRVFEPYSETFEANNEHAENAKHVYTNSTPLEEFRNSADKYKKMAEEFEGIPARATVRRRTMYSMRAWDTHSAERVQTLALPFCPLPQPYTIVTRLWIVKKK